MNKKTVDGVVSKVMTREEAERWVDSHLEECPECGEKAFVHVSGCGVCLECGYTPCGA